MGRRRTRRRTVAYPTFRWRLNARRPIEGYPASLDHIGHHLLRRRLELGLQQKEAAKKLGSNPWCLRNWETGRHEIEVRFYPAIISFLGYNPLAGPKTQAERVTYARMSHGWSRKRLARISGVDEATVRRIEAGASRLRRPLLKVCRALGLSSRSARSSH